MRGHVSPLVHLLVPGGGALVSSLVIVCQSILSPLPKKAEQLSKVHHNWRALINAGHLQSETEPHNLVFFSYHFIPRKLIGHR